VSEEKTSRWQDVDGAGKFSSSEMDHRSGLTDLDLKRETSNINPEYTVSAPFASRQALTCTGEGSDDDVRGNGAKGGKII